MLDSMSLTEIGLSRQSGTPCVSFGSFAFKGNGPFHLDEPTCGQRFFLIFLYYPFNIMEPTVMVSLSFLILIIWGFSFVLLVNLAE